MKNLKSPDLFHDQHTVICNHPEYPDLDIVYIKNYIDEAHAGHLFEDLKKERFWESAEVKIFGRLRPQPRLSAWVADESVLYTYSGLTLPRNDWIGPLRVLKNALEHDFKNPFNSVLLNYYRNGNDSMGWHQDNEQVLGVYPVIASVSLGSERIFKMKHIDSERKSDIHFNLSAGDLLLMKGATQEFWRHSLPKTSKPAGERINLTFRQIKYDA